MSQGVVVDLQPQLLCFLAEDRHPLTGVGLEETYPDPTLFLREAALHRLGVPPLAGEGEEEVVVAVAGGELHQGIQLLFRQLFLPTDQQQIGPSEKGALERYPLARSKSYSS